jgi:hypothetical protein
VTPHEGIAFFKRGTRVGGRKDKEQQLRNYTLLKIRNIAHVNMSTTN